MHGSMPVRVFVDSTGVNWRVWSTVPTTSASVLSSGFDQGWLTFECDACVRRLAPIPRGWEDASADRLELMCRAAQQSPRRTPPRASDFSELHTNPASDETPGS
jgi:hypothetical protein